MHIDSNIRKLLENETKIHTAEIRFLYQKLDRQFGLNAARFQLILASMRTGSELTPPDWEMMRKNFIFPCFL